MFHYGVPLSITIINTLIAMYPGQSSQTHRVSAPFPPSNFSPPPAYPYQPGQQPYYPPPPPTGQPYYAPSPYPPPQQYAPPPDLPPPYPQGVDSRSQGGYMMHVHQDMAGQPPPNFQLSNCRGRKRALLIGINYFRQNSELRGCINDAHNMRNFLIQYYGYRAEDMVMLTDDNPDPSYRPTRANMINAMHWLVHDARPNDAYFFHYSGHGGLTPDLDGDEEDGYDETIYPVDHQQAGMIVDDEMHAIMVRPLPPGCRLTAVFDSCHSGTALDLPYVYSTAGTIKDNKMWKAAGQDALTTAMDYARGDVGGMLTGLIGLGKKIINAPNVERAKAMRTSQADVIMFSGCKDDQTSADAVEAGRATGAMSHAFIVGLSRNTNQSYTMLLNDLRAIMQNKYSQRPQLSASHPMDMNLLFIC